MPVSLIAAVQTNEQNTAPDEYAVFAENGNGLDALGTGWSSPESWGVWSDAERAFILLRTPLLPGKAIHLEANLLLSAMHHQQRITIHANTIKIAEMTLTEPELSLQLILPAAVMQAGRPK